MAKRLLALTIAVLALSVTGTASAADWGYPLHRGMEGPRVKTAQYLLQGHNHFRLRTFGHRINGHYGRRTAYSTKRAKYYLGFPHKALNGRFGAELYSYLTGRSKLPTHFKQRRFARLTLHLGARGQRVKDAQWLMQGHNRFHLRTYSGRVNGVYDRRTSRAAWWAKYALGFKRPIYGDFGPKVKNVLRGRAALTAQERLRRKHRAEAPVYRTLDGFLRYARTTLGTAYRWGGTNPFVGGADCSGLTQYLYSHYWRIYLGRTTYTQVYAGRYESHPSQIGDLIFYGSPPHHVAMYVGNGQMIEDPHTGAVVRITSVRPYTSVRRVLPTFLPGSLQASQQSSGFRFSLTWWEFVLLMIGTATVAFYGGRQFARRTARALIHEIGDLADLAEGELSEEITEAIEKHEKKRKGV